MSVVMAAFLELLKVRHFSPAKIAHVATGRTTLCATGRTMLWWYVDNNDDRFATVFDLPSSGALVLMVCDGKSASSVVMSSEVEAVDFIERGLKRLARNS